MAEHNSLLEDIDLGSAADDLTLTTAPNAGEAPEVRHGFMLGEQPALLAADVFSELAAMPRLCPVPDTPVWFAGFINHRGHTLPVYDLQQWLTGSPVDRRQPFYALLFDRQPHAAGFLLAELPTVLTAPTALDTLPAARYAPISEFVHKGYKCEGHTWLEIDHQALLNHLKDNFHQPVAKAEVQDNS
ncbi:chemotaxis protein CheW [Marinobacterium sp. AK62]|uniref:Chemotaxis protein CheW n=1 Tax=Marinobacterium alkalitolerans TaxID=1542925 RepID=A0ABS3ZE34_9GAMM|nr:chemotaxis protein CheW [Marinobacterium alkalitolerans]MBP0049969.1 chemotaxis protein CheW [Marinobacterium alkalitolerans]